jgi:hypothetical protein
VFSTHVEVNEPQWLVCTTAQKMNVRQDIFHSCGSAVKRFAHCQIRMPRPIWLYYVQVLGISRDVMATMYAWLPMPDGAVPPITGLQYAEWATCSNRMMPWIKFNSAKSTVHFGHPLCYLRVQVLGSSGCMQSRLAGLKCADVSALSAQRMCPDL